MVKRLVCAARLGLATLCCLWLVVLSCHAQQPPTEIKPAEKAVTPAPSKPAENVVVPAPSKPAMPGAEELIYLVRNTTIAINQANLTGNYSVLLALATEDFQKANSVETLANNFAALRNGKFDFGVTLAITPQFSELPSINDNGILRLTGYYPTQPRGDF